MSSQIMMGLSNSSYEAMEREDYDEDEFLELSCLSGKQLDCIIQPVNGKGGVYIGNIEAAQNIHLLDSLKIRAVLTLDDKFDYCYFNCKVSAHKVIKIQDRSSTNISEHFIPCLRFIERQRQSSNILIHCFAGISRSSTISIAFLMARFGLSLEKSYKYIKSKRKQIQPNKSFLNQLKKFENYLRTEKAKRSNKSTSQ